MDEIVKLFELPQSNEMEKCRREVSPVLHLFKKNAVHAKIKCDTFDLLSVPVFHLNLNTYNLCNIEEVDPSVLTNIQSQDRFYASGVFSKKPHGYECVMQKYNSKTVLIILSAFNGKYLWTSRDVMKIDKLMT